MSDSGRTSDGGDGGDSSVELPSARGRAALWVSLLFGAVLVGLLVLLATREPAGNNTVRSPLLGLQAPAIATTAVSGERFDIDEHRDKWVVVNFFATWCVECVREHPELIVFDERHRGGDVQLVSIAFDDRGDAVAEFFARNGGEWPVLVADTGTIALDWSVAQVPETYLVRPGGQVAAKFIGGVTADGIDQAIADLTGA